MRGVTGERMRGEKERDDCCLLVLLVTAPRYSNRNLQSTRTRALYTARHFTTLLFTTLLLYHIRKDKLRARSCPPPFRELDAHPPYPSMPTPLLEILSRPLLVSPCFLFVHFLASQHSIFSRSHVTQPVSRSQSACHYKHEGCSPFFVSSHCRRR